jgi:hypothetical protein
MNSCSCGALEGTQAKQRHRPLEEIERKTIMFARHTKEYAEIYTREVYPQIEKIVAKFIEGVPTVKKFEAEYSTFHKVAFAAKV